jgi:hypothetical protein
VMSGAKSDHVVQSTLPPCRCFYPRSRPLLNFGAFPPGPLMASWRLRAAFTWGSHSFE